MGVVYSKLDSDSSISTASSFYLVSLRVTLILYVLVHKSFSFSEARDQVSARVLKATDDETQSQTDNTIKQVTDASSEIDKPKVMHASDGNAHNRVRFLYELYGHNSSFRSIRTCSRNRIRLVFIRFSSLIVSRFAFMRDSIA